MVRIISTLFLFILLSENFPSARASEARSELQKDFSGFFCRAGQSDVYYLQYQYAPNDRHIYFAPSSASLAEALNVNLWENFIGMSVENLEPSDCQIYSSLNSDIDFSCNFGSKVVNFDSTVTDIARFARNLLIRSGPDKSGARAVHMSMDIFDRNSGSQVASFHDVTQFDQCTGISKIWH